MPGGLLNLWADLTLAAPPAHHQEAGMGKLARTVFFSLLFIAVILGIIIANIGWPAFWEIVKSTWIGIEQSLRIGPPG